MTDRLDHALAHAQAREEQAREDAARVALRAVALRLIEEADAAGIGAVLQMGSAATATAGAPAILVHDHYADPLPLLRRATKACWHESDQGRYDEAGAWHPYVVAFLDAEIDGVHIDWNGTPAKAAEIRAQLEREPAGAA